MLIQRGPDQVFVNFDQIRIVTCVGKDAVRIDFGGESQSCDASAPGGREFIDTLIARLTVDRERFLCLSDGGRFLNLRHALAVTFLASGTVLVLFPGRQKETFPRGNDSDAIRRAVMAMENG